MNEVRPITRTVNLIIILSLTLGLGLTIVYFSYNQNVTLKTTTRGNLHQQADLLYQSIKNAMLPGNAPNAVSLFSDIKDINPSYEIMLFRAHGVQAFSDNATIETVNKNLDRQKFKLRSSPLENVIDISGDTRFKNSVAQRKTVAFEASESGRHFFTIYKPLLNLPKCTKCHGSDHTVRGVIKISSDITPVLDKQRINLAISGLIFIVVVFILTVILTRFFHRKIINPVKHIGEVCISVTNGNFSNRVSIPNRDEIGVLGETVNRMVEGLYERFQLSKFVSSSTIQSIRNKDRGARAEIAILFSDIRSFTAFSENLPPEEVVERLNGILSFQTDIIHRNGGDVDKYVGDEVVALFSGEEKEYRACKSALEIQQEVEADAGKRFGGLHLGIGINAGEVILGMIGSEERADFTVIGDHVNFASRLCDAAKPGQVIISENIYNMVKDRFKLSSPYKIKVKGKENYQKVFILEERVE